jgi:hypothetical protein
VSDASDLAGHRLSLVPTPIGHLQDVTLRALDTLRGRRRGGRGHPPLSHPARSSRHHDATHPPRRTHHRGARSCVAAPAPPRRVRHRRRHARHQRPRRRTRGARPRPRHRGGGAARADRLRPRARPLWPAGGPLHLRGLPAAARARAPGAHRCDRRPRSPHDRVRGPDPPAGQPARHGRGLWRRAQRRGGPGAHQAARGDATRHAGRARGPLRGDEGARRDRRRHRARRCGARAHRRATARRRGARRAARQRGPLGPGPAGRPGRGGRATRRRVRAGDAFQDGSER